MNRLIAPFAGATVILIFLGMALRSSDPTIYLLPLEAEPELLESLQSYYRRELALDVEILPSIQLTSATWNTQRQQARAEKVIELINTVHRALDPRRSMIIGITSRDLYIEERPWLYAFSWRHDARLAVVSYARMSPPAFQGYEDIDLLESRVRKMVTRNIGVMRYRIPMTADRRNLMYQDVLGLEELDALTEDLARAGFPGARGPSVTPEKLQTSPAVSAS